LLAGDDLGTDLNGLQFRYANGYWAHATAAHISKVNVNVVRRGDAFEVSLYRSRFSFVAFVSLVATYRYHISLSGPSLRPAHFHPRGTLSWLIIRLLFPDVTF
jgi:hypothetical protein